MCVCMYVCMYVHVCMYVYVCVYVYACTYMCVCVFLVNIASYPGHMGIRLRLEIGKNQYVYVRYISVSLKDTAVCQLNYLELHEVEDNCHVYEGKNTFLWLPTSFGKSVRYEVLSFAC